MAPCTRTHRPVPASHFPANQPDLGSPGHRVGDKRIADDGKEYLVAIIGPAAEITADVVTLYEWLQPVGVALPAYLSVWSGALTRGQRPVPSPREPRPSAQRPFAELDIVASAEGITALVVVGTGAADTDPVRAHLLTYKPYPVKVTPALGPEGRFLATYESQAKARAAVVHLRESLNARPARYDVVYDAQAEGLSWVVSIPSQPRKGGGEGAAGAAVARQSGESETRRRQDNRPAWMVPEQHGGSGSGGGTGGPCRVPLSYRAPAGASPGATEGGAEQREKVGTAEGPGDGGVGYGRGGGALCRVPAARDTPGGVEGGAAEMETGEMNEDLGDGRGGYGSSGGALCRGTAARAPPGVFEGGAAEMETAVETAPHQQTETVGKKKKKSRRSSKGAKATADELRQRLPGHQRHGINK